MSAWPRFIRTTSCSSKCTAARHSPGGGFRGRVRSHGVVRVGEPLMQVPPARNAGSDPAPA